MLLRNYFHVIHVRRINIIDPILVTLRYKTGITMKYLNVAEKNDAAKNIAIHLSRGTSRRREGLSPYNKIYDFEANVFGENCGMVMTSVSGHLLALEFVGAFKGWQSCNPLALFDAPVYKYCPDSYQKIKKTLEREIRGCQGLIIWTDCDREGENIGFEIIQVCTAVKNGINIYRAKFSEITAVSVRRALQQLEAPNKNISDAVDVRQELDLRIGAAFTRFQTLRLQRVFPTKLSDKLVSYGSCQFPTLGFVVERYRAVENFVSEQFWKIKVNHTINNLSVDFAWDRVRLFDKEACRVLHNICAENPEATVHEVKTKPKSKWRPLPLDTVEMEKLGSRKLKINAKETMKIAEKLYTQGLISYPRTETNEFPKEMNLAQLVGLQVEDPRWGAFAQGILDNGGPTPRQGNKTDKAHPPIHPTKYTNGLTGNEQKLYEFIVRSFLACCSLDAQGQETCVSIDVAAERFSASGLMIIARNYLDVYPYDKWSSKEIHVYQTGQIFSPTSIDMVEGSTSPPNLLTEADLIALMEKHGIGTDATHAEHIETIKSRLYVELWDSVHFVPGLLGMGLVEGYDAMGLSISRPHLRAQLEADLRAVSRGERPPHLVLAEQVARYKEVYVTVAAEADKIDAALGARLSEQPAVYTPSTDTLPADYTPVLKCPKCDADMVVKQKKNSEELYISCTSYPNCKNALWLPSLVRAIEVLPDTCTICGPPFKRLKFQWRNNSINHLYPPPYTACVGGCDTTFLEFMNINLSNVRAVPEAAMAASASAVRAPRPPATTINAPRPTANRGRSFLTPLPTLPRNQSQSIPRMAAPRVPATDPGDDNIVMCVCNKQAILLTVKKQNANLGKKFYKCPVGRENGGCDFFLWAPEGAAGSEQSSTPPTSADTSSWGSNQAGPSRGWGVTPRHPPDTGQLNGDNIMCNCGLPAKKLTVNKEGPNKGRSFYGCPNNISSRCSFFQWAETDAPPVEWGGGGGSGGGGRGGRGRGARGAGGGGGRRCGLCRQEGHTRAKCPNAHNDFSM